MEKDKYLSVKEAVELTGAGESTITKWCREGRLPNARKKHHSRGYDWEIPESDLLNKEVKMGRPKKEK